MTRPETQGFQKPLDTGKRRDVRIAMVRVEHAEAGSGAECSCGKTIFHRRGKVVDRKIEKHVNEKHGGQALWL